MPKTKKITNILLLASLVVLLVGGGYKAGEYRATHSTVNRINYNIVNGTPVVSKNDKNYKNIDFSLFWDTWAQLEEKYVDRSKIDPQKMFYGAIKGMVASVEDPYTFFLTPEENKQSKDDLGGKFEGIGAQLGLQSNRITVVAPIKNSPAETAGLKSGDFINKVNGESTKGWLLTQAVAKIRGEKGTSVKLTVERDGKEFDVDIKRDTIKVESVEAKLNEKQKDCGTICGNVAYLKLNQFGENTVDEWEASVASIKQAWDRKQIKGMVLDLRDNPGGYLESSVYLAGEFLPKGTLVVKQESKVFGNKNYDVERTGTLLDIPLVVLVNKGSASAAEILAGALRDHKRAKLIGEKTFGKGSVQEALDLREGAGIHVTVAKWVLPSGEWINSKGIEPEIKTELKIPEGNTMTRDLDTQLDRAIEEVTK
jgi:carboxyl-terminal processing protease